MHTHALDLHASFVKGRRGALDPREVALLSFRKWLEACLCAGSVCVPFPRFFFSSLPPLLGSYRTSTYLSVFLVFFSLLTLFIGSIADVAASFSPHPTHLISLCGFLFMFVVGGQPIPLRCCLPCCCFSSLRVCVCASAIPYERLRGNPKNKQKRHTHTKD